MEKPGGSLKSRGYTRSKAAKFTVEQFTPLRRVTAAFH
jgi:hypothetical protein